MEKENLQIHPRVKTKKLFSFPSTPCPILLILQGEKLSKVLECFSNFNIPKKAIKNDCDSFKV